MLNQEKLFDYSCSFWYPGTVKVHQTSLQIIEKLNIRFISNLGNSDHIRNTEFTKTSFLKVSGIVK